MRTLIAAAALWLFAAQAGAQCTNCPVSTNSLGDADIVNGFIVSTKQAGAGRGGALYLKNFDVFGNRGTYSLFSLNHNGSESYFQLRSIDSGVGGKNLLQAYSWGPVRFPAGPVTVEGGNFGVGTFNLGNPGQAIELLRDNADVAVRFHDPGDAWYTMGISNLNSRSFYINRGPNPGSNPDLVIDVGTGNVGVGAAMPTSKLTVGGDVAVGSTVVINANGQWVGDPTGLVGPQGPQGLTGPQGPQGPQGPPGPAVETFANCGTFISNGVYCEGVPACPSNCTGNIVMSGQTCTATSQNGSCSATGNTNSWIFCGRCCTCRFTQ